MRVLSRAKYLSKLYIFKRRWRKANPHNRSVAKTIFPMEKVVVGRFTYGPLAVLTWGADEEKLVSRRPGFNCLGCEIPPGR